MGPQDPGGPPPRSFEWQLEAAWPMDEVPWWPHVLKDKVEGNMQMQRHLVSLDDLEYKYTTK